MKKIIQFFYSNFLQMFSPKLYASNSIAERNFLNWVEQGDLEKIKNYYGSKNIMQQALYEAIQHGHSHIAQYLLDDISVLNAPDIHYANETLLEVAALRPDTKMMEFLLTKENPVDMVNNNGKAIRQAINMNNYDNAWYLLHYAADRNIVFDTKSNTNILGLFMRELQSESVHKLLNEEPFKNYDYNIQDISIFHSGRKNDLATFKVFTEHFKTNTLQHHYDFLMGVIEYNHTSSIEYVLQKKSQELAQLFNEPLPEHITFDLYQQVSYPIQLVALRGSIDAMQTIMNALPDTDLQPLTASLLWNKFQKKHYDMIIKITENMNTDMLQSILVEDSQLQKFIQNAILRKELENDLQITSAPVRRNKI